MKRILKSELDKFYTKIDTAKYLINKVDISSFDVVIEPSCGSGSFYNQIEHKSKIGVDIAPEMKGVISHDFLTLDPKVNNKNVLAIGNPPFGKQGSLAMKFINKSAEYCSQIAFILPISFMKDSYKNRIPDYFHLVSEEILDENSFELNGDDFSVKCCFQIWEKRDYVREKIKKIDAIGFEYTKDKSLADLSVRRVGVYAGNAFSDCLDKSEQSHYFLILDDKTKKDQIIESLNSNTWSDLTVGPKSISKSELNKFLNLFM